MNDRVHLKGLNGIRAIAASIVIIHHIGLSLDMYGLPRREGIDLAGYGVTMFFALSGFLITYLLLVEKAKFGSISIRQFYVRRILRIWPLYYLYILLFGLIYLVYDPVIIENRNLFFTIFFSANIPFILGVPMGIISHFWSIGVEEQFYLFWPWLIRKTKNSLKTVGIFIVVFFSIKMLAWLWLRKTGETIPYLIFDVTRFDCMAIGAFGAILFHKRHASFLKVTFSIVFQIIAWGSLCLLAFNSLPLPSVIKDQVVAILTVGIIVNVSSNVKSIIKLNGRIPDFLGNISYGLYVYHMAVIFLLSKWLAQPLNYLDSQSRLFVIYPLVFLVTILVAAFSFYFFERRFLALKSRFSPVVSRASER